MSSSGVFLQHTLSRGCSLRDGGVPVVLGQGYGDDAFREDGLDGVDLGGVSENCAHPTDGDGDGDWGEVLAVVVTFLTRGGSITGIR